MKFCEESESTIKKGVEKTRLVLGGPIWPSLKKKIENGLVEFLAKNYEDHRWSHVFTLRI